MTPSESLKAIADDCYAAAEVYETSPGLAGHGVNAGTVVDLYRRIALSVEGVIAALSEGERR